MVKYKHTPPKFLLKKLDDTKLAYVTNQFPLWVEHAKAKHKGELPDKKELLFEFIEYLGKRNTSFQGLHPHVLKTTH